MTKRIQRFVLAVSALAALALGGSVFAQAQTSHAHKGSHQAKVTRSASAPSESTTAADGDNVQSGDQTTPDTGSTAAETSGESPGSESAANSDGPGGHADEPGNANADHQFQGNE
jgi:hypothetical protein